MSADVYLSVNIDAVKGFMMSASLSLLSQIIGKPVWGAKRSNGSSFMIEIGHPHLYIREASKTPEVRARSPILSRRKIVPVGEYRLLLIDCYWTLFNGENKISDDDNANIIESAIDMLNGNYIEDVEENYKINLETVLKFDDGQKLLVKPVSEGDPCNNWTIRVPDGTVWALCPDGSIQSD